MILREIIGHEGSGWHWRYFDSPEDPELRVMVSMQDGRLQVEAEPHGRYQLTRDMDDFLNRPFTRSLLDDFTHRLGERLEPIELTPLPPPSPA